jgi:outer membrane protein OmpA-like peptidoglycan-associated protein
MKTLAYLMSIAFAGLLIGCAASIPPPELVSARQAYQEASAGQAAQLVPAELHKAQEALAAAEKSFQDQPKSFRTRDLAYVADRKAKMAEALATTAAGNAAKAKADKEYQASQTEIAKNTAEQLAVEQKARLEAEKKTAEAEANLAKLATVKEEARGLVIALSGSVLFASNKSELLPAAQDRLNQVAEALMATKERRLTIEGYTDSQGSSSYNQKLSQERAETVRAYLISRGYPGDLIRAQGIGEERPIADNANAEGRANNRRVEIIVDRAAPTHGSMAK